MRWRGGPVDQEIEPNGGKLTLYRWWDIPEKASEEEVVHPAFWCEAMKNNWFVSLKGKPVCSKGPG